MAFDIATVAVVLGLRLAHREGIVVLPAWLDRLLAAVLLVQLLGVVWQWAALFLRSDGYAVLANVLRCHDLWRATWLTSKQRLWRLTPADAAELGTISPGGRVDRAGPAVRRGPDHAVRGSPPRPLQPRLDERYRLPPHDSGPQPE